MGFKWRWIKAPVALSVLGKVLPAAAIALAACWGCVQLVGTDTGGLITARLVRFAVPAIAFFAVFALVVTVLRLREARDILSLLRRRG
ncbi:MAG: hypothetical protein U5N86_13750 [Planctomycetota bacterium]|nr:hypothetical protein [Planctomycetota bacterium]